MYVDDIKLAGKKHNIDPMRKVLNKEVDLGEPTSFFLQPELNQGPADLQSTALTTEPCTTMPSEPGSVRYASHNINQRFDTPEQSTCHTKRVPRSVKHGQTRSKSMRNT